jgi:hypothetical protein
LQGALFDTEAKLFAEEVKYRDLNKETIRPNQIKQYLHEILTNAIFNYAPCSGLLKDVHENEYPSVEDWKNCIPKWKSLSAEPYQPVSKLTFILFNIDVCETH